MDRRPDLSTLAKYPFFEESKHHLRAAGDSLDEILGRNRIDLATRRVENALFRRFDDIDASIDDPNTTLDSVMLRGPDNEKISSRELLINYALARILVSCLNDRGFTDRYCLYEAERAWRFWDIESEDRKRQLAGELGIYISGNRMPVKQYVELTSHIRGDRWRLVNRRVKDGFVQVAFRELDDLFRERVRTLLSQQLPLDVPESLCRRFEESTEHLSKRYQERILEQFGEVDEGSFPPCISTLTSAITSGTNLPHTGRFAIVAFLHTIGMDTTEIVNVFSRAPDFDIEKSMYQVEHITGRGGTEYTPPSCATLRTYGLCVGRDSICEKVSHPLSYYRIKKKKKPDNAPSGSGSGHVPAGSTHHDDKEKN